MAFPVTKDLLPLTATSAPRPAIPIILRTVVRMLFRIYLKEKMWFWKPGAKAPTAIRENTSKLTININTINEFTLFNPRNAYQNYNVAVNTTQK
jgi:hypothetical protein